MFTSSSAGHHLGAPEEVGRFRGNPQVSCVFKVLGPWKYKKLCHSSNLKKSRENLLVNLDELGDLEHDGCFS